MLANNWKQQNLIFSWLTLDDHPVTFIMQLVEVETEAAQWQEEMKEQKRIFEKELDRHRQEAELLKVCLPCSWTSNIKGIWHLVFNDAFNHLFN